MLRRLVLGALSMGYSKLALAVVQLAQVPALANAWGLTLYGHWLLIATVPMFLAASDFGFGTAAGNRLIGEVARDRGDEALITFQSAWLVILASCAGIFALVLAISAMLPDSLFAVAGAMNAGQARLVLAVLSLYGLVTIQIALFGAALRAGGRFALSTSVLATTQLVEGLAVIVVVLKGHGPLAAALALLGFRSLGILAQIALARRYARWLKLGTSSCQTARIKELLRPAIAAMVLPLAQAGYLQGTALAVGAAAGPSAVPIFTALRTLSRVGLQLLMTLNLPLMPEYTAAHARGEMEWVKRATGATAALSLLVGAGYGLGLALCGEWLLDIWTRGAVQPPLLMILFTAAGVAAAAPWTALSNLLIAINRHEAFSYVFLVAAAAVVALTYAFVARWGLSYAAAANLVLDLAVLAAAWLGLRRSVGPFNAGPAALLGLLPGRRMI